MRGKLKGIRTKELPENVAPNPILWTVGEDMPFSFDEETLRHEAKKTIHLNYKRGAISLEEKNVMMKSVKKC